MPPAAGNPVLAKFLKEWWETAKEQNLKSAPTFKRAYDSIKLCPITLNHPSEASKLNGVGPKICKLLTEAYEDYCTANGLPLPRKARGAQKRDIENSIDAHLTQPLPAPKRRRIEVPYVPKKQSGPYAIMIALREINQTEGSVTKERLIQIAQPHCHASFKAPIDTTKTYTAWNSMKMLEEKGLVHATRNPIRYSLTKEGLEIADGIVRAERREGSDGGRNLGGEGAGGDDGAVAPTARGRGAGSCTAPRAGGRAPNQPATRRRGSNIDLELQEREAWLNIDDGEDEAQPRMPANELYEILDDDGDAPDNRPAEQKRADVEARRKEMRRLYNGRAGEYGASRSTSSRNQLAAMDLGVEGLPKWVPNRGQIDGRPSPPEPAITQGGRPQTLGSQSAAPAMPRSSTYSSTTIRRNTTTSSSRSSTITSRTSTVAGTKSTTTFPHSNPTVLQAKRFTVQLILDNREVRSKSDRDYVQKGLLKAGVTPDTRALNLGDALWVARDKEHEIVLDYIVERKRMDDLITSIRDGRFHEQKFRLTKSAVKNVTYIIEDYSLRESVATNPEVQKGIDTAISSIQVVNGFFVKRTKMLDDTIRYLARMTHMLEDLYHNKDLHIIPDSQVEAKTYLQLREHLRTTHPGKDFYLTYDTFSALVDKNAPTTLRHKFLKMLMCVRGVTAEKALQIQRNFETPSDLLEAYEKCDSEKERVELVLNRCNSAVTVPARKIGAVVSRKIKEVWWGEDEDQRDFE